MTPSTRWGEGGPGHPAVVAFAHCVRAWGGSVLHTPLFAGFPGFRSKLWADDLATGISRLAQPAEPRPPHRGL